MKLSTLIIGLALLVSAVPCWAGGIMMMGGGVAAPAGDSSILFFWGFENNDTDTLGAAGVDYPASLGGTAEVTPTIDASVYKVGSYAFHINAGYERTTFAVTSEDLIDGNAGAIGLWLRMHTNDNTGTRVFHLKNADDTNNIIIQVLANGHVEVTWNQGGSKTYLEGTTALSADTWYWIEFRYNSVTPSRSLHVGTGDSDPTAEASSSASFAGWSDQSVLEIGRDNGIATAVDYYMDNIIIRNTSNSLFSLRNSTSSPR